MSALTVGVDVPAADREVLDSDASDGSVGPDDRPKSGRPPTIDRMEIVPAMQPRRSRRPGSPSTRSWNPRSVTSNGSIAVPKPKTFVSVEDARQRARRVLPAPLFDYIDGGAQDERTLASNAEAFAERTLAPRVGGEPHEAAIARTVLGDPLSMPVLLAPCGMVQAMHPDGVLGVARAAHGIGTVMTLSTFAGTAPEVLAAEPGPRWFQLYAADRDEAEARIGRARDSGFGTLVVTLDSATVGVRERDLHHGMPLSSFRLTPRTAVRLAPHMAMHPRWLARTVRTALTALNEVPPTAPPPIAPRAPRPDQMTRRRASAASAAGVTPGKIGLVSPFTWADITWLRERWPGSLAVKGVLSGVDARRAVDSGAQAVIVSNHGGRQLDGAPATLRVLPAVRDAVGADCEVLLDGGIRRGGDVVKALALGAHAVCIGRPYLYALAAAGQVGVEQILQLFHVDIRRTMLLLGCGSLDELDESWLGPVQPVGASSWERR
jgi:L-lactate dehydrogenase (cytochrome)